MVRFLIQLRPCMSFDHSCISFPIEFMLHVYTRKVFWKWSMLTHFIAARFIISALWVLVHVNGIIVLVTVLVRELIVVIHDFVWLESQLFEEACFVDLCLVDEFVHRYVKSTRRCSHDMKFVSLKEKKDMSSSYVSFMMCFSYLWLCLWQDVKEFVAKNFQPL